MSENASKLSDNDFPKKGGGEGGIRTLDTLTGMPHFECGAFDHSATSPKVLVPRWARSEGGGNLSVGMRFRKRDLSAKAWPGLGSGFWGG